MNPVPPPASGSRQVLQCVTDAKETLAADGQTTAGHQPFSASEWPGTQTLRRLHHLPLPLQLSSSSRPRNYPSQRICLATRRLLLPSSSRHVVAVVLRSPGCSVPARCIPHAPRRLDEGGRTPVSSLTQPRPHKLQISPCICRSCPPWGALSRPLVHSSGLVVVVVVSQSPFSPFVRGLWICPEQKHPTFFFLLRTRLGQILQF